VLRTWLAELSPSPDSPLFPGRTGDRLSRDAVEMLVAMHAATAEAACPSVKEKNVQQPGTTPGRYRPPDSLLAFLDTL
jgi:integrase/recombinase XerD